MFQRQIQTGQTTLGRSVRLDGSGVHANRPVRMVLHPAEPGHGVVFHRVDLLREPAIEARWNRVTASEWRTRLGGPDAASVDSVEHVLAALAGLGVDNVRIELDGPEAPILDGSAQPFVEAVDEAGIVSQPAPRRVIAVRAPVRVAMGSAFAELAPGEDGLTLDVAIDYPDPAIGQQRRVTALDPLIFRGNVARARTFGFVRDVERMWRAGFARGSSLDNSVAIAESRVLNAGGLRFPDEFVRHKTLDAIGDLALAGAPLLGRFRSFRGGHRLNHAVLRALFANPSAWAWVEAPAVKAGVALASAGRFSAGRGGSATVHPSIGHNR